MALANLSLNTLAAAQTALQRQAPPSIPCSRGFGRTFPGRVGSDKQRSELLAGLRGRVLEVGAGDGRNFAHYPSDVSEVLAIEPEPYLRRLACDAARAAPVTVKVVDGTAELLPHEDGVFDSVVSSLVLCSVIDQEIALAELHRVLMPGGELRFYEHVVAERGLGKPFRQASMARASGHISARDVISLATRSALSRPPDSRLSRFGGSPRDRGGTDSRSYSARRDANRRRLRRVGTAEVPPRSTRHERGTRQCQLTRGGCAT